MPRSRAGGYRYEGEFFDYIERGARRSASAVVAALLGTLRVRSVLDVGCGRGVWLDEWHRAGVVDVTGVDGSYVDVERLAVPRALFEARDVSATFDLGRRYDLVQAVEVAEHIPEDRSEVFLDNLVRHGDLVLFSAAAPGQGGEYHVNEQPYEYWRRKLARRGFTPFDFLRPLIHRSGEVEPWYRYNLLLYAAAGSVAALPPEVLRTRVPDGTPIRDRSSVGWRLRKAVVRCLPPRAVLQLAKLKRRVATRLKDGVVSRTARASRTPGSRAPSAHRASASADAGRRVRRDGAFGDDDFETAYPVGIEAHFWHQARSRIIADALRAVGWRDGTLLEIGAGRGIVVDYLRRQGFRCWGCDIARPPVPPRVREAVLVGQDHRALPSEFRTAVRGILLLDVLEHLPRPASFLRELRDGFPSCALLVATVPARSELWSNYDEHYGHYRRYDRPGLRGLLEEAGFQPSRVRYLFGGLYLPAYAMLRLRGGREVVLAPPRCRRLARVVGELFRWEARVLPSWFAGTSLLAVATTGPGDAPRVPDGGGPAGPGSPGARASGDGR